MTGKRFSSSVSATSLFRRSEETETKFGLCGLYPGWVQSLATPRTFLICFCIKNILQGMIFSYLVGIETSLERHFQFNGSSVGLLLTLGEIGPILTAVWISHMGSHGNRPRWMGFGLILISVALFMAFSMYLIFPPPRLDVSERNGLLSDPEKYSNKLLCHASSSWQQDGNHHDVIINSTALSGECTIDTSRRHWAFATWVIIYSIMGVGGMTVYTIGAPYLDDSVSNQKSPLYFSITMAVRAFGPVFGNLLSAACLRLYIDTNVTPSFKSDDPRWIGAWWLGLLIMACLIALYAMVIAAFPRRMPSAKGSKAGDDSCPTGVENPSTISASVASLDIERVPHDKLKDFKESMMRLLRNPILIYSCGSATATILGVVGYLIWLPKYFEHEFRVSKSQSALFSGLSGNATMIFGVLTGGYLMTRFKPSARKLTALVAGSKFIYAFGLLLIMLANCGMNSDLPGTLEPDGRLSLAQGCNNNCNCNTEVFVPVCLKGPGDKQLSYFSPCHAGCMESSTVNKTTNYTNCVCGSTSTVNSGYCLKTCNNIYVYMVLLATIKFVVSLSAVGNLIVNLRCVEERDKALALGLLGAVTALLGFLPNPIIFGSLLDSSCLIWEQSCGQTGSCWVYDTDQLRYKLHGLTSACLIVAAIFECLTFTKVKNLKLFAD